MSITLCSQSNEHNSVAVAIIQNRETPESKIIAGGAEIRGLYCAYSLFGYVGSNGSSYV